MTSYSIQVTKRENIAGGKVNALRAQGYIPGIVYGSAAKANISVAVKAADVRALLREADTDCILVNVDCDGEKFLALIKDVQRNFLTDSTMHVDFLAVTPETVVRTKVYLKLNGTPVGVATGGQTNQIIYEIPVKCAVKDIPAAIEADITPLALNESLRLSQITLPAGVTTPFNGTVVLASVVKP